MSRLSRPPICASATTRADLPSTQSTSEQRPSRHANDARERIAEIGEILAAGLIRLRTRQSSRMGRGAGESSLEHVASQSGHANPETENAK
jgi:hypothetical protein